MRWKSNNNNTHLVVNDAVQQVYILTTITITSMNASLCINNAVFGRQFDRLTGMAQVSKVYTVVPSCETIYDKTSEILEQIGVSKFQTSFKRAQREIHCISNVFVFVSLFLEIKK